VLLQASCVAIAGRAVLITGAPGVGKSSLALALIDRGAVLIGDDGVNLTADKGQLFASPPANICGLLEVRNLGLLEFPVATHQRVVLTVKLTSGAPRFIEQARSTMICGCPIPELYLWPDGLILPRKVELALERFGLR
jgi:serine kinase of HPr protein (carbohydrate metabolism regulator)